MALPELQSRPKIMAIAPWFGSKRTLAPRIVQELGKHRPYFEPFCGSCAVLLAKEVTSFETVNDLHGDLVNLARCLSKLGNAGHGSVLAAYGNRNVRAIERCGIEGRLIHRDGAAVLVHRRNG